MDEIEQQLRRLSAPFDIGELEWRLLQAAEGKDGRIYARVLPYLPARAIQDRLDSVLGPAAWHNQFGPGPAGGVMCGISIWVEGRGWVTKWDGAANSEIEAVKGGLSGAMKRAAVQWGIGRYLYGLPDLLAEVHPRGRQRGKTREGTSFRWDAPTLPAWAVPEGEVVGTSTAEAA